MIGSIQFWAGLSAWLLGLSGIISVSILLVRNIPALQNIATIGSMMAIHVLKAGRYFFLCSIMLAAGFGSGWFGREVMLARSTETLADVLVLQRHSDKEYRLQTDKGQAFDAAFCTALDLQAGQKLKVLTYEQSRGCKSITGNNLGFIAYTAPSGDRLNFLIGE